MSIFERVTAFTLSASRLYSHTANAGLGRCSGRAGRSSYSAAVSVSSVMIYIIKERARYIVGRRCGKCLPCQHRWVTVGPSLEVIV